MKVLSQMIPGVGKQSPAMTYPNVLTLSLTRGGLAQVNRATFIFFCYLILKFQSVRFLTWLVSVAALEV